MKAVSVVIPAYNESGSIMKVIASAKQIPEVSEIIVVDDASVDETAAVAMEAGAKVIRLPVNRGKGEALKQGIALATGDVVLLLDADLGESAVEARALILPVMNGEAHMTVARFPAPRKKGGFGLVRGLARAGIRHFTGLEVTAPLSGQRAISREALHAVQPLGQGYGVEVALTIRAARRGYSVTEVPVSMSHRETGRDLTGFIHRGRQFRDVLITLGRLYYEYRFGGKAPVK
jgi:glycosyltransferase involved in cell wall biosynthesis